MMDDCSPAVSSSLRQSRLPLVDSLAGTDGYNWITARRDWVIFFVLFFSSNDCGLLVQRDLCSSCHTKMLPMINHDLIIVAIWFIQLQVATRRCLFSYSEAVGDPKRSAMLNWWNRWDRPTFVDSSLVSSELGPSRTAQWTNQLRSIDQSTDVEHFLRYLFVIWWPARLLDSIESRLFRPCLIDFGSLGMRKCWQMRVMAHSI